MAQNPSLFVSELDASSTDVVPPHPVANLTQNNSESPTIETLYEGDNSNYKPGTYLNWQATPLKQAKGENNNAITVYMIKDLDQPNVVGNVPLEHYRIDVRDRELVAFLEPILKKKHAHLNVYDTATFIKPFQVLYECHEEIVKLCNAAAEDDKLKPLLKLLAKVLNDVFLDTKFKSIGSLKQNGLISFNTAWAFFQHGTTVLATMDKTELLCKVDQASYTVDQIGKQQLTIGCKVICFNGDTFVWEDHVLTIDHFAGNRPVAELNNYPLVFHEDPDMVMSRLVAQGHKILEFQGLQCRAYDGIASVLEPGAGFQRRHVDGRIVIDVKGFYKHAMVYDAVFLDRLRTMRQDRKSGKSQPVVVEQKSNVFNERLVDAGQKADKDALTLNEEHLAFLFPLLNGYLLKKKTWAKFLIDHIQPVCWNDDAYDHLVHDEYQKDQILSFVANHPTDNKKKSEGVISGKGEGLLILLSGPSGTGKTLTAEAVADKARQPLLNIHAEDLGLVAKNLGSKLKSVLELATEMGAVVLLDEADVFMSKRNYNDIHHNEFVSIFLRELEYFRGTMFLTTNLLENIDNAFLNRMSMHIVFKPLSTGTREAIWDKVLARQLQQPMSLEAKVGLPEGEARLSEHEIQELARWNLNGREITNVARMVRALCDYKGHAMTLQRLESGIKVTSPFAIKSDVDAGYGLYY
ncbi:uncharacterized protein PgNI_08910 [Pyricularia grisea]|uniref:AAA+ ATPase domain-containing protein n=1 Tax=Pyricularia grisea TaxID=148305 RepID=A0A6P8AVN8_PYRGI|nr:uncharacterized protein PgNI_08910 [Pyricularia grisea]TLD06234.1 hypothetical protein PgNI_08910 [Pyricularia grisea]